MKSLVEQSITIKSTSKGPKVKTIFDQVERGLSKYLDISELSGKSAVVEYQYVEAQLTSSQVSYISIPADLDELGVKEYIIAAITQTLNN